MSRRFLHSLRPIQQRQLSSFRFRPNKPNRFSTSSSHSLSGLTTRAKLFPAKPTTTNIHHFNVRPPLRTCHTTPSKMASSQRTYDDALSRLAQLQSNRTIVNLFGSSDDTNNDSQNKKPAAKKDLNSLAIPEMLSWLARAGYTPSSLAATGLKCVHVAGTKGKGSVSALVSSIISQYPPPPSFHDGGGGGAHIIQKPVVVGTYTSPHVLSVRERIQLDNVPISREKFALYFFEVWDRLSAAARAARDPVQSEAEYDGPGTKPFYFRFLTILAFHIFVREGVKQAVIECGIGGEYDSTNFLSPQCVTASVVTQLGIDHVTMLGNTLEKIAWNKSGIFRPGVKGFTRRLDGEAQKGVMEVLRNRAQEKEVKRLVEVEDEQVEKWKGVEGAKLEGPFQKFNMALAVAAAREHLIRVGYKFQGAFGEEGWELDDIPAEFEKGLKEASLKGRCESLRDSKGTEWFVDGAHTEDSLAGVGQWFAGKVKEGDVNVLVFNQQDRDPEVLLRALLTAAQKQSGTTTPVFTYAVLTRNEEKAPAEGEPERDLAVQLQGQKIVQEASAGTETSVYNAVESAMEQVQKIAEQARKNGKTCNVLVTGSFHLLGGVLKTVEYVEY
ncbi:folC protein [Neurospora intermedia]|uniref:Folylpolyglutamate synthase n=1 Tax=Neurospora intermedia TaxID=5142 RepID=A0ABR3DQP3_NEUIN